MNRLIICNTPYQVLVAVNMSNTMFKDGRTDIIISNHFVDGEKIAGNISQKKKYFRRCYYVETLDFSRMRGKYKEEYRELLYNVDIDKQAEEFVQFEVTYDELWIANYERFSELIYNYIIHRNRHAKVYCYEDGCTSCCDDWFLHVPEIEKKFTKKVKDWFSNKIKYTPSNFAGYYVFNKDQMTFDPGCPVYDIPVMQFKDNDVVAYINDIFGYSERVVNSFDEKYIFFEEAMFSTDKSVVGDMQYIEDIADIVGKENLVIKLHPRSYGDRFTELGYKVSKVQGIPWEVIALNMDLHDKVLISNSSTAIISPTRLFGMKYNAIYLFELTGCILKQCHRTYFLKNYGTEESMIKIPKTKQELIEKLDM